MTISDTAMRGRDALVLFLIRQIPFGTSVAYQAINCGVTCNCSKVRDKWSAWTLDTEKDKVECSPAPTFPSVSLMDDGTTEWGAFAMATEPASPLYAIAANYTSVTVTPLVNRNRLPLFIGPDPRSRPTLYDVEVELHSERLNDLPDRRAANAYHEAMAEILWGKSTQCERGCASDSEQMSKNQIFPVEVESDERPVPGVLRLAERIADRRWSASLHLTDAVGASLRNLPVRRASEMAIGENRKMFVADVGVIKSFSGGRWSASPG